MADWKSNSILIPSKDYLMQKHHLFALALVSALALTPSAGAGQKNSTPVLGQTLSDGTTVISVTDGGAVYDAKSKQTIGTSEVTSVVDLANPSTPMTVKMGKRTVQVPGVAKTNIPGPNGKALKQPKFRPQHPCMPGECGDPPVICTPDPDNGQIYIHNYVARTALYFDRPDNSELYYEVFTEKGYYGYKNCDRNPYNNRIYGIYADGGWPGNLANEWPFYWYSTHYPTWTSDPWGCVAGYWRCRMEVNGGVFQNYWATNDWMSVQYNARSFSPPFWTQVYDAHPSHIWAVFGDDSPPQFWVMTAPSPDIYPF